MGNLIIGLLRFILFEDGNGRIARAISDISLARADGMSDRFYSITTQIEAENKEYYRQLELQQGGTTDITGWLDWFLACFGRALSRAEVVLEKVIYKSRLWGSVSQCHINERQRHIINLMLKEDLRGHINTSKYAKLAKCSNDTALRDITELKNIGILNQNEGRGRSTSYRLNPDYS